MDNKLLLVDDEEGIRKVLGISLTDLGYQVLTAENGEEALEIFRRENPPIVLTDIKMPGMDGPMVLNEIRKKHEFIPVVLLTGYPDSDLVAEALAHGPVTLLAKPVDLHQLNSTIQMALNGRAQDVKREQ